MRELLIYLAMKYRGSYRHIRKALEEGERGLPDEVIDAITIVDDDYPRVLRQLRCPPYVLFYKGNKEILHNRLTAVVGSRASSPYGEEVTREIVSCLNRKYTTVSGLARGIDALVHRQSLHTIGVSGCGLDICYPKENERLYHYMAERQLIISEYPPGVRPLKEHFPFRNRIIAALGEQLIVTQAAIKSGTMLTVNEALELGRDVYTVPYRLSDPDGAGCNYLIQQGANVILNLESTKHLTNAET